MMGGRHNRPPPSTTVSSSAATKSGPISANFPSLIRMSTAIGSFSTWTLVTSRFINFSSSDYGFFCCGIGYLTFITARLRFETATDKIADPRDQDGVDRTDSYRNEPTRQATSDDTRKPSDHDVALRGSRRIVSAPVGHIIRDDDGANRRQSSVEDVQPTDEVVV